MLELQIADLGVWGPWLPPGWRLTGAMHAGASIGGRFGAPEYTGELTGKGLGVRNVLQGVDVRDGDVSIVLLGDTARIERFTANAGNGSLTLRGDASLGAAPRAELGLRLDRFQLLGRVDRRIVTSGDAVLKLGRDTLALDGDFNVDEGLIDFSRSEAPRLSDDVHVRRGSDADAEFTNTAAADAGQANARARRATLNLRVGLGEKLARARPGPGRRPARRTAPDRAAGPAARGRQRAHRTAAPTAPTASGWTSSAACSPSTAPSRTRNSTSRPRVRTWTCASAWPSPAPCSCRACACSPSPTCPTPRSCSWLLRGRRQRGPGLGRHRAAAGRGDGPAGRRRAERARHLFNMIGLDDLSVRQSDSVSGGTIVSVGKQLSRNWYVGYERGAERHHRQLAADLPHRAALHHPRAIRGGQLDRADLELALAVNAQPLSPGGACQNADRSRRSSMDRTGAS